MGIATDLRDSVRTRMAAVLGVDFSELTNVTEIEKNAFKGANKRYGVVANEISEVLGSTCHLTVDQNFEMVLTNGYFSNVKASDSDKRGKALELQDLMFDIYKDLKTTKSGSPSLVMQTYNLNIQEPEYLEENHVVAIRATLTIKYRSLL